MQLVLYRSLLYSVSHFRIVSSKKQFNLFTLTQGNNQLVFIHPPHSIWFGTCVVHAQPYFYLDPCGYLTHTTDKCSRHGIPTSILPPGILAYEQRVLHYDIFAMKEQQRQQSQGPHNTTRNGSTRAPGAVGWCTRQARHEAGWKKTEPGINYYLPWRSSRVQEVRWEGLSSSHPRDPIKASIKK